MYVCVPGHVCVCVYPPFSKSLCSRYSSKYSLDITSLIIALNMPKRNLSLRKLVRLAWYYTADKRVVRLHTGLGNPPVAPSGGPDHSPSEVTLPSLPPPPASHPPHPYPGPSCSLQSCRYSPSPRFHSGPSSWWWPLVTVGVCWMARSRLQGEHVRMSYFYSPVDQVYGFSDNELKGHKHNPKELFFPLQSSAGSWSIHTQNVAWPGTGVQVTSTLHGASEQLIFGCLAFHRAPGLTQNALSTTWGK